MQASDSTQLPTYGLPLLVLDPLLKPSGGHSQDALEPALIDMLFSMQMRCVSSAENQPLPALHNGLCIPSRCLFLTSGTRWLYALSGTTSTRACKRLHKPASSTGNSTSTSTYTYPRNGTSWLAALTTRNNDSTGCIIQSHKCLL